MGCSSCAEMARRARQSKQSEVKRIPIPPQTPRGKVKIADAVVVGKSDTDKKVKLRYYGGGVSAKMTSGCRSCSGGGAGFTMVTTETIMFASEDSPNSLFKRTFTVGHDYWVTEKQAEYLLSLTYQSRAKQIFHKFKRV